MWLQRILWLRDGFFFVMSLRVNPRQLTPPIMSSPRLFVPQAKAGDVRVVKTALPGHIHDAAHRRRALQVVAYFTAKISKVLHAASLRVLVWLTLAHERWCGDSSSAVPDLDKFSERDFQKLLVLDTDLAAEGGLSPNAAAQMELWESAAVWGAGPRWHGIGTSLWGEGAGPLVVDGDQWHDVKTMWSCVVEDQARQLKTALKNHTAVNVAPRMKRLWKAARKAEVEAAKAAVRAGQAGGSGGGSGEADHGGHGPQAAAAPRTPQPGGRDQGLGDGGGGDDDSEYTDDSDTDDSDTDDGDTAVSRIPTVPQIDAAVRMGADISGWPDQLRQLVMEARSILGEPGQDNPHIGRHWRLWGKEYGWQRRLTLHFFVQKHMRRLGQRQLMISPVFEVGPKQ